MSSHATNGVLQAPSHEDVEPQTRASHKTLSPLRQELVVGVGEFVGTFFFLFFALGALQVAVDGGSSVTSPAPVVSNVLFIAAAFGTSLAVNAWIFFRVSGSMFNPAASLTGRLLSDGPL